jgi:aldehyde:ferredoxin oxidoreductase
MKELYGWAGKVCFVDLNRRTSRVEPTEKYLSFIGGPGVNQWLLFTLLEKDVDPLGPDNVLILGAGPIVGTLVPSASRLSIEHKNVITGGVGSGNCGGRFAAEMKYAGYDHIVVVGKAAKPTYIYIEDDSIHFRDASDIWGKGTWETDNAIKSKERDNRISTLTIGIAGENLVKFACIIGDRGRAAAYGGGGAVMGSKNLKAIAIRGKGSPIRLAKPNKFINRLRRFEQDIFEKSEAVKQYRWGGTVGPYVRAGENRHGVRNMSSEFWSNQSLKNVTREKFDEYLVRRHSCFSCPVFCSAIYEVSGMVCEGIQANSLRAFGSNVNVTSAQDILFAHALVNSYGLDCDQTSAAVAWAIECYERGIIDRGDTEGLELKFGDGNCVARLIEKIAHRKGLGDVLARGVYEASKTVGRGSEKLTALVKRTSVMEAGVRSHKAWALGIMTSTKGAGHLRGATSVERRRVPPEVSKKLFGIDDISGPTAYKNKASLVVWQEKYKGLVDMMGICALTSMWQDIDLFRPEDIAGFLSDITGMDYKAEGFLDSGERLQNLERSFNLLHAGFDRSDDMPPRKFIDMPINKGMYKGESLDVDRWNQMLDEYYEAHGWEKVTGWPTKKRLVDLELDAVADKLARNGILLS